MKPKVVLLIFVSGKIVLTGAKVREEIYMAFNQIYSVLVGTSFSFSFSISSLVWSFTSNFPLLEITTWEIIISNRLGNGTDWTEFKKEL
jgi:hypothetical protein